MRNWLTTAFVCAAVFGAAQHVAASPIVYSNLSVTNAMAAASRPSSPGGIEIEAADDFLLTAPTLVNEIKFIGLITGGGGINPSQFNLEFYRVFPNDSDVGRTSGPPTFSTSQVPTRVNSPSDVAFAESGFSSLTVTTLSASFTALNSVSNGINPKPGQTTGGDGAVTGVEFLFDVFLSSPVLLPADHYFFVPQVGTTAGQFYWLSASRPIVPPGTPFMPDLQAWIRNTNLDPDWLRIGTDIVGGTTPPTFNLAFEIDGTAVPEPATLLLLGGGLAAGAIRRRRAS